MNYESLISNTLLALFYFKKFPAAYLEMLTGNERNSFVKEWNYLVEDINEVMTEGMLVQLNHLFYKHPALRKQFLGRLSMDEIAKAVEALDEDITDIALKLNWLNTIRDEAFAINNLIATLPASKTID